jgi:hypothetical protein
VHEECQGAQSHIVVDVHSWPGWISLVLGDVDRSEVAVAVGDILRFLVACPEPAFGDTRATRFEGKQTTYWDSQRSVEVIDRVLQAARIRGSPRMAPPR